MKTNLNFGIRENNLGYYGIIDKDTNQIIIPHMFEDENELKQIETIERFGEKNYILHLKNTKINGFYDIEQKLIVIPNKDGFNYYDVNNLKTFISVNNDIGIILKGKKLSVIISESKKTSYLDYDYHYQVEVDNYEIIDNKVLILKQNGKVMVAFDIEDKKYLKIKNNENEDAIIAFKDSSSKEGGIETLSIIDLKNKKYIKDFLEQRYSYYGKIDEEIVKYFRKEPLVVHKEILYDYFIEIKNNIIFFDFDQDKNNIIYDINNGMLIKNIETKYEKNNDLHLIDSKDDKELCAYDASIGKMITLIPIKVKSKHNPEFIYHTSQDECFYHTSSRIKYFINEVTSTIFKSTETGKYYHFNNEEEHDEIIQDNAKYAHYANREYKYDKNETLKELYYTRNGIYDTIRIPSINKYAYVTNNGVVIETCDNDDDILSLLSDEKITIISNVINEELKKPELLYESLLQNKQYPRTLLFEEIITKIKIIISAKSKNNKVTHENMTNFIKLLLKNERGYENIILDDIINIYIIDDTLFLEMKDKNIIKIKISDYTIINLIKIFYEKKLEKEKEQFDIIEENECYGLKNKKGDIILPPIFPTNRYQIQEIYNIKEVKKIMENTYLIIDKNGYYGLMTDDNNNYNNLKKIVSKYSQCEFDGFNLTFKSDSKHIKNYSIEFNLEFLKYYLKLLKNKGEIINSNNIIQKIKEEIPSNINFTMTNDKYDIINEHIIIFKYKYNIIICDLNKENPLVELSNNSTKYSILNNQVILSKEPYNKNYYGNRIYDIKHQKIIDFTRGIKIENTNTFFLTDNDNNFYDMRTGFFFSSSYINNGYIYYNQSEYIVLNNKLFYAKKEDEKKKTLGIYDLETGIDKKEKKFTEFREINVGYEETFIIESKDGEKLLNKKIKTIIEIRDVETIKSLIDVNNSNFENILYIINGKLYCVYKNNDKTILFQYESNNLEEVLNSPKGGKSLTLKKKTL